MKITLIETHAMVRDGLVTCLGKAMPSVSLTSVANEPGVLRGLRDNPPDVLVLGVDAARLDQMELAGHLKRDVEAMKLIFLSMQSDASTVRRAFDAGADGYVLRDDDIQDLVEAVHEVVRHRVYLSPQLRGLLELSEQEASESKSLGFESLTDRQVLILTLFASGLSTREIAEELKLNSKTLDRHRRQIQWSLGVDSIAELTRVAVHHGLVRLDGSVVDRSSQPTRAPGKASGPRQVDGD